MNRETLGGHSSLRFVMVGLNKFGFMLAAAAGELRCFGCPWRACVIYWRQEALTLVLRAHSKLKLGLLDFLIQRNSRSWLRLMSFFVAPEQSFLSVRLIGLPSWLIESGQSLVQQVLFGRRNAGRP